MIDSDILQQAIEVVKRSRRISALKGNDPRLDKKLMERAPSQIAEASRNEWIREIGLDPIHAFQKRNWEEVVAHLIHEGNIEALQNRIIVPDTLEDLYPLPDFGDREMTWLGDVDLYGREWIIGHVLKKSDPQNDFRRGTTYRFVMDVCSGPPAEIVNSKKKPNLRWAFRFYDPGDINERLPATAENYRFVRVLADAVKYDFDTRVPRIRDREQEKSDNLHLSFINTFHDFTGIPRPESKEEVIAEPRIINGFRF